MFRKLPSDPLRHIFHSLEPTKTVRIQRELVYEGMDVTRSATRKEL